MEQSAKDPMIYKTDLWNNSSKSAILPQICPQTEHPPNTFMDVLWNISIFFHTIRVKRLSAAFCPNASSPPKKEHEMPHIFLAVRKLPTSTSISPTQCERRIKAWKSQWDEVLSLVCVPLLLLSIIRISKLYCNNKLMLVTWGFYRIRFTESESRQAIRAFCSVSQRPQCVFGVILKENRYPKPSLKFIPGVIANKIFLFFFLKKKALMSRIICQTLVLILLDIW